MSEDKMNEDDIIKEVRQAREQHAAKFDYDLKRIVEDLRKIKLANKQGVVSLPPQKPLQDTGS